MPVYEVEKGGKVYEIEASDMDTALAALGYEGNTLSEDIQGFGQTVLDGLFVGFGDEISAAGRAGLGELFDTMGGLDTSETLKERFDRELKSGREIEENFRQDHAGLALASEIVPAMVTGTGIAKMAGMGATRGANAIRGAGAATAEMAAYQIGEKEGDLSTRYESLDAMDALVIASGPVLGAAGGSLMRGLDPDSATLGELTANAAKTVANVGQTTGEAGLDVVKGVGKYTEKALDLATGGRVSPIVEAVTEEAIIPTVKAVQEAARPVGKAVGEHWDKAFTPVRTLAVKKVNATFGSRLERGAIQGQRATEEVDRLMFETHHLGRIRNATMGNPRAMAAMADFGNSELKWDARKRALNVLKEELGETDYNDYMGFVKDQEALLNKYAPYTQTEKRTVGHMSIARDTDTDLATKTLREQREAGEASSRLSTSDATMKDKKALSRLSEDGTTLSKYGQENPIQHPIDSHHYFMRANAQMGSMNKALGIRGAATAEERAAAAQGKFYQDQLRMSTGNNDDAVELYNQVVWGSQRSMAKELQVVRNLGYASTIANPYGALLQAHDGFNAAFAHGSDNMLQAMLKKSGFDLTMEDVGILRAQFNEMTPRVRAGGASLTGSEGMHVMAQQTEKMLDWAMKHSGFQYGDTVMKGKIMQSGLLQEQAILKNNPSKWRDKWKHTFDKAELDELEVALRDADNSNDLLKQLGLLKLSKLQPISAASNTYYQLAIPNARIFYMLKGFAITQLDLIKNRIKQNMKEGGIKQAGPDMLRYMALSAGGYGLVHETRQLAKGELPDYSNIPTLAFYQALSIPTIGASGGTDYGFEMFRRDPMGATMQNYVPPMGPIEGVGKDLGEMFGSSENPNKFIPDETLKDIPIIGPTLFSWLFDE
jgi:hypothetical protein